MTYGARGLYEVLITELVQSHLKGIDERSHPLIDGLRPAEAADRIAIHVGRIVQRAVDGASETDRVAFGVRLARSLVQQIVDLTDGVVQSEEAPTDPGEILRAIVDRLPDGRPVEVPTPLIPLLDTTLLTNSPGEPRVGSQLLSEIHSADRIDLVMAFIRRSGIYPLLDALRVHSQGGRPLRVLTTTYTASTEPQALDALRNLGADVRVSYDTASTRLHAKAWLFHRASGFSTAYIGSSNLTHSAQITGLEWNVRASGARNPAIIDKVAAVFESYWNSGDFVPYDSEEFVAAVAGASSSVPSVLLSPIELRLEPFQERLLEEIALSRGFGHHRNLLVSATGTGKTVMAAVDYSRLRSKLSRSTLLFVAHREEILEQSLATFRYCLRDHAFGELWVGGQHPRAFEHVFASIQSIRAAGLKNLDPRHFDVVIVDEFHHAAARSYRSLLDLVRPVELLGLTATPERTDGLPVLEWFDNRIAAELRLWDAIDQHRLSPFIYYGIHDGLDLRDVPWMRGRGYDVEGLSNLLTANDVWARHVVAQLTRHADDVRTVRALGFCVSVAHARFMARAFLDAGIPATAVWADSPENERIAALQNLRSKRVNVVFSVDLFNEGIDVPEVDTLLLLRPTDSPTLFLQQLGRGLRRSHSKSHCTVLDFVGQHRKEFRFDRRLRALLGGTRKQVIDQIENGFPFLPSGCHMELDRVATDIVLRNIREAVPSKWTAKVEELRQLERGGKRDTLALFLEESDLELEDVYAAGKSWSDLRADAGVGPPVLDSLEERLRRACGRLLHVDDLTRIAAYRQLLSSQSPPPILASTRDRRLVQMLLCSLFDKAIDGTSTLKEACELLWKYAPVREELLQLLEVLETRVDHVHSALEGQPEVPLQVHARYSRREILAAFGIAREVKLPLWQSGAYWEKMARADLLAFTLDKTSGQFSPTTRYKDYAISPELIHWESQSTTRAESETGMRYQTHSTLGTSIMLFARLRTDDRAFWFLGPATYVKHESELPMAVIWRLHHRLSGDLFAQFAAAVA